MSERKTKISLNGRNGTMSGMEFQAFRARNTPAYINLFYNDPVVGYSRIISLERGRSVARMMRYGGQQAVRYSSILIAKYNIRVGDTIDGASEVRRVRSYLKISDGVARTLRNDQEDHIE